MILLGLLIVAILIYYFVIYKDINIIGKKNSLKKCPNCGSDIEDNFNICPICKVTLIKRCPNCGSKVEAYWNFCPQCEKPIEKSDSK